MVFVGTFCTFFFFHKVKLNRVMFMDEVSNQMVRVNEVEKDNKSYRSALSCDVDV